MVYNHVGIDLRNIPCIIQVYGWGIGLRGWGVMGDTDVVRYGCFSGQKSSGIVTSSLLQ